MLKRNKSSYSIINEFKDYDYIQDTDINRKNYINNRILGQIEWYDSKSSAYQMKYKSWTIASTILSATIPILTLALNFDGILSTICKFAISIISSFVTVISCALAMTKYKELWIQYRTNCEILKSILHKYCTKTGEFDSDDIQKNFSILTSSCEDYLTKEFEKWEEKHTTQSESSNNS